MKPDGPTNAFDNTRPSLRRKLRRVAFAPGDNTRAPIGSYALRTLHGG
jgi:hypothetical protein